MVRELLDLISLYLDNRATSCNPKTIGVYHAYLRHYAVWVATNEHDPFIPETLRAYIAVCKAQTQSSDTLRNRVRYVRLFFSWLADYDWLSTSPFEQGRIKIPPKKRSTREGYTEADVIKLLNATGPTQWKRGPRVSMRIQWQKDGPMHREALQGRALVLLLVDSALRAFEVAALTCGQIRAPRLKVRSKGDHWDVAFISATTREVLLELAGERPDEESLFRDFHNRAATTRGLRGILDRLAKRAGVTLPPRPLHAFRHYAAQQWLKAKVPDLVIQQFMRHESITTTQIYTKLTPEDLAALHAEASSINVLVQKAGLVMEMEAEQIREAELELSVG